jgi:hypothetical protein
MKVPGALSVTVTVHVVAVPMVAGDVHKTEAVIHLAPLTVKLNTASGLAAE